MRLLILPLLAFALASCIPQTVEHATAEQAQLFVVQHEEQADLFEVVLGGQMMSEVTLVVSALTAADIAMASAADYPQLAACRPNPDLDRSFVCRYEGVELVDVAFVTVDRPQADAIVVLVGQPHTAYIVTGQ